MLLLLSCLARFRPRRKRHSSSRTPAKRIEVSIVNVDTVVTDKQGRRVHGLRKEDFEIYENGVRQPITNFAEYASERDATPAGVATPSAIATTAAVPRNRHRRSSEPSSSSLSASNCRRSAAIRFSRR